MKKYFCFLLLLGLLVGCKSNEVPVVDHASNFTGSYKTVTTKNGDTNEHVWIVTRRSTNVLEIAYTITTYYIERGTPRTIVDVVTLTKVQAINENTFEIDETITVNNHGYNIQGTGVKSGDQIAITTKWTSTETSRETSEYLEFKKQ
ncbi:hypothetical protein GCM10027275_53140 [Rhabdobacter roseus]|uniref:Uncharacterized protein YcfL n=1 Tax=Rhabdobacter roseus TaxID=1655419 RepID=A0A840TTR8_9BACT|nr:hypothetical protein [Rhabdobacter roseus]MBB5286295.1 uncharacterized protein YcfL [Rhabdobacter roseus]